jgi:hypothetical protein
MRVVGAFGGVKMRVGFGFRLFHVGEGEVLGESREKADGKLKILSSLARSFKSS